MGASSASAQRANASPKAAPGPYFARSAGHIPSSSSSLRVARAREANSPRMARMAASTFSRMAWAPSTLAYTHRKRPSAPPFSTSRSANSAEVLPVCRGAWRTKNFCCRIKVIRAGKSNRRNGGMQ